MKVYILTEGQPNTGHEFSIKCVCGTAALAEHIQKAFPHYNLVITEYEVAQ